MQLKSVGLKSQKKRWRQGEESAKGYLVADVVNLARRYRLDQGPPV